MVAWVLVSAFRTSVVSVLLVCLGAFDVYSAQRGVVNSPFTLESGIMTLNCQLRCVYSRL